MPTKTTVRHAVPVSSSAQILSLAARRGANLLDTLVGAKWPKKVKLPTLDMESGVHCVLGQVHGDFTEGLYALAEESITRAIKKTSLGGVRLSGARTLLDVFHREVSIDVDATYYGFQLPTEMQNREGSNSNWELLGSAWTREINKRRAANARA